MLLNTEIVTAEGEVASRLAAIGLDQRGLVEALKLGSVEAAGTTSHNPDSAAGYYFYSATFRALCDWFVPTGQWRKGRFLSRELIINDEIGIVLSPRSGNERTGDESARDLRTRNRDGYATRKAVRDNQLVFEEVDRAVPRMAAACEAPNGYVSWFLLHHTDEDGAIQAEVACPGSVDEHGDIDSWLTRIIIGPVDGDPGVHVRSEPDVPYEPDVAVSPKSG